MTNPTSEPTTAHDLDAWGMACAVLSATRETLKVARGELEAAVAAHYPNPFGPGISTATQLVAILDQTERDLSAEMHRHARSNNFPMPAASQ